MFLEGLILTGILYKCYRSSTSILKELYTDSLNSAQGFSEGSKELESASIGATNTVLGFRYSIINKP